MTNILEKIIVEKEKEVACLPELETEPEAWRGQARTKRRDFVDALSCPKRTESVGLIAEIKKASPSAGVICDDFDPVAIAREYARAGADCLSILTDEPFFQGTLDYLGEVREAVSLPLLRKDFIIDRRQVWESVKAGADAILLIVAVLSDRQLQELYSVATRAGLSVLVEVHDETELERALSIGAVLIGVNNRDLKTFEVDLGTTERLVTRLRERGRPESVLLVAESGIHNYDDVARLRQSGAGAILVGESLMRGDATRIGERIARLLTPGKAGEKRKAVTSHRTP